MTYKEKVIDLLKQMVADTKKKRDHLERYQCSEDVKRLDGGLNFANNFLVALTSIKEDPVPEKIGKEPEDFVAEGKTFIVNEPPVDDQPQFNLDVDENNVFTELAESDDERIRKDIVSHFESIKARALYDRQEESDSIVSSCNEKIAWLEKQKYDRMKPIYDAKESFESALEKAWNDYHNGYESVDKLEDDYVECAHAKGFREGYLFGIEKEKKQKPVVTHDENGDAILSDFEAALFSAFSDAWQTYLNGENVNVVEWAKEHAPELLRVAVKPAERVEINKSLIDAVMAELNKYNGENYWKSPWATDSTGLQYPLYFANLGARWQKEQKPIDPSDDELQRHQDELYDFKAFAAKQAKEHHISFVHDFEWNNFCAEILSYFNEKQKPAWSEEDKQWLSEVYFAINHSVYSDEEKRAMKKYVDSLRSQSKPAEWSEEDKLTVDAAIYWLERKLRMERANDISTGCSPLSMRKTAERLKSLRLRSSWKPSEEQIAALKWQVEHPELVKWRKGDLESLLEQLKKLYQ